MYSLDFRQFERTLRTQEKTLGRFTFRPLSIPEDTPLLHSWVTRPYAIFWGLQGASAATVEQEYRRIADSCDVYLGLSEQGPVLLMEVYDPANGSIGSHYPVNEGDAGMHILVAPPTRRISGYTWQMFTLVMDFLFSSPEINRVVVEPDSRNHKIHALNRRAGFIIEKQISLPEKSALLSFCARSDYQQAMIKDKDKTDAVSFFQATL
ncbi:GNAT family N-acetyltransferase [Candidatus Sororendozoicomonas aggregata]|uniref:GNAT family N-acetyltransferase n=1 Tax=Candidatus Sororendozoicomonas aggregata TaxID=3073239 RepID=UPI002ED3C010